MGVGVQPEAAACAVLQGREAGLVGLMRLLDGRCAGGSGSLPADGEAGTGRSALASNLGVPGTFWICLPPSTVGDRIPAPVATAADPARWAAG